jgi:hypothetical protein
MNEKPTTEAEKESRRRAAARRALDEAEARRARLAAEPRPRPTELNGPKGPEPTRYGDWERKGIASDF